MNGTTTLSKKILLGLLGGITVGLFFGEKVAFLEWPAKAFVQLLQVTVLPCIVTSLVLGIARGTPSLARRLASRGGLIIALLWALSLALVFLSPLELLNDTLGRAGSLLVGLTPLGIFAIAGHAAGTLRVEQFERLQAFFLISIGLSLVTL